VRDFIRKTKKK